MISSSTPLPMIIIFEQHWDEPAKKLLDHLIPNLTEQGYDTLCMEAPQDLKEDKILASFEYSLSSSIKVNREATEVLNKNGIKGVKLSNFKYKILTELMYLFFASVHFHKVSELIKELPAKIILNEVFKKTLKNSWSLEGIDIDADEHHNVVSPDMPERMAGLLKVDDIRIDTMIKNLLRLHKERKGLVVSCGAFHADKLMDKIKQQNLENQVLYYFPYAHDNEIVLDNQDFCNNTLNDHKFSIKHYNELTLLVSQIVKDVKSQNTHYRKEIYDGTASSRQLSQIFKKDFKAFTRPGYNVDALLEINEFDDVEEILVKLERRSIGAHKRCLAEKNYLVVPDINTAEVASKIIKSF